MSCMLTIAATMIDRAIMVIGNPRTMAAGKPMTTTIGKSHHRSTPKITTIISMNLQMPMSILMIQTTFKTTMCTLHMEMDTPTQNNMTIIRIGTTDMNDMSVPLQFLF